MAGVAAAVVGVGLVGVLGMSLGLPPGGPPATDRAGAGQGQAGLSPLGAGARRALPADDRPVAARPGWRLPLDGPPSVTRPFVAPAGPYAAGHRGVDLAAPPGSPVRAAAAGRVTYAGMLAGRGVVVVSHGELRTTYEPVTATVRVGDVVAAGAELGRLAIGHDCRAGSAPVQGACLHWGLRRGDVYLDPMSVLRRAPSRLLPTLR